MTCSAGNGSFVDQIGPVDSESTDDFPLALPSYIPPGTLDFAEIRLAQQRGESIAAAHNSIESAVPNMSLPNIGPSYNPWMAGKSADASADHYDINPCGRAANRPTWPLRDANGRAPHVHSVEFPSQAKVSKDATRRSHYAPLRRAISNSVLARMLDHVLNLSSGVGQENVRGNGVKRLDGSNPPGQTNSQVQRHAARPREEHAPRTFGRPDYSSLGYGYGYHVPLPDEDSFFIVESSEEPEDTSTSAAPAMQTPAGLDEYKETGEVELDAVEKKAREWIEGIVNVGDFEG